jgi:murein DD-endopeptidase MepM/ murein hydrolase activator NlpD
MRTVFLAFAVAVTISSVAYARPEWIDPVRGMALSCGFLDPNYIRTPCRSSGSLDSRDSWRQHLGADFRTSVNATVVAPVTGRIVLFHAEPSWPAEEAFLVIRDAQTNEEHVIGHISSTLRSGAEVTKGNPIGTVRDQGANTHVHWGFNLGSVAAAMRYTSRCSRGGRTQDCQWGWGKAPYEASEREVRAQGWRNVL